MELLNANFNLIELARWRIRGSIFPPTTESNRRIWEHCDLLLGGCSFEWRMVSFLAPFLSRESN